MLDVREDGIKHINIYSKGRTELGRLMSNFAYSPFEHPLHGKFFSIEGYWYWLSSNDDRLRMLYGYKAKKQGRELRDKNWIPDSNDLDNFRELIKIAITKKVEANLKLKNLLISSTLPFIHYYVMYDKIIDKTEEERWILDYWESLRTQLKELYGVYD